MTPDLFRQLVAEAALSPSVHNIQPTRWRYVDETCLALIAAPERQLPVGDPTGRDAMASHGAAAEGLIIAASARGIGLTVVKGEAGEVARLKLGGDTAPDPLYDFLPRRRTYRGPFEKARHGEALDALSRLERPDIRLIIGEEPVADVARLADEASLRSYRNRPYREELRSWMRLTPVHKGWSLDGLNAQAMAMPVPVALAAGAVLAHPVFEALDLMGLAGPLTGEASVTRSAAGLVAFVQDREADPFTTGRNWHRLWLEMTAVGLSCGVLTILGDDAVAAAGMAQRLGLSPDQRLVTVFRAGMVARGKLPLPARLPVERLILS